MRYSKILLAIVLISMLIFGSSLSAYAETDQIYTLKVFVAAGSIGMGTVSVHGDNGFEKLDSGSVDLAYSGEVCVEAVPNAGYRFVKWERCFNFEGMNFLDKPAHFVMSNLLNDHQYVPKVFLRAYFEPAACIVKVHYKYGDRWISPEVILTGAFGAPYASEAKVIAGYELTATPANATGVFGTTEGHVDYIYRVATTQPTTEPTTAPTTAPPTTEPTTAPTTGATTEPTTAATTAAPTTEPTTAPTTAAPTTAPTTAAPTTNAPTEPPTQPSTIPTTAPATTPTTEATVVITTEAVPLGAPQVINFDEILEENVPLNIDEFVEDEPLTGTDGEEILDDEVPLADGLPQTGQLSADMFYGIGGLISGLGLWLKRRK